MADDPQQRQQVEQVVFTAAPFHSGTTLLGMMLGGHPKILFCGEAMCAPRLGDRTAPPYQQACRICGVPCPLWSTWNRHLGSMYDHLAAASGRPVIFDSSKSVTWVQARSSEVAPVDRHLVVLQRDGRAVVNSLRRKNPQVGTAAHTSSWVAKLERIDQLADTWPAHNVHRLRYEDLVTSPTEVLTRLCRNLGHEFQESLLTPWRTQAHPLDSNPGPLLMALRAQGRDRIPGILEPNDDSRHYLDDPLELAVDERWRSQMSTADLRAFEDTAQGRNGGLAWDPLQRFTPSGTGPANP